MKRERGQLVYFNDLEKLALVRLSKAHQVSQSEMVRLLIRDSARQAGIWPVKVKQDVTKKRQPA